MCGNFLSAGSPLEPSPCIFAITSPTSSHPHHPELSILHALTTTDVSSARHCPSARNTWDTAAEMAHDCMPVTHGRRRSCTSCLQQLPATSMPQQGKSGVGVTVGWGGTRGLGPNLLPVGGEGGTVALLVRLVHRAPRVLVGTCTPRHFRCPPPAGCSLEDLHSPVTTASLARPKIATLLTNR